MTHGHKAASPKEGPEAATAPASPLKRSTRTGVQTWEAPPARVLPLLTPLGEKAWAVGWEPEMRWQAEGSGEGTLFVIRSPSGSEAVWVLQTFDTLNLRVAYAHLTPGTLLVELSLQLSALQGGRTRADIRYTYTALSEAGNAHRTEAEFEGFMRDWEREMNHFLATGRKLDAAHP